MATSLPILLLFLVFSSVNGQSCQNPNGEGPCVGGQCPQDGGPATCLPSNVCCLNSQIVTTTTPSATTTASCVDLLNPQTGTSDCPGLAYLCNNSLYFSLMTQQCPKTCGRCSGAGSGTTAATTSAPCKDLLNPQTGVSDCPANANLCNNSVYYSLMTQQCPKTCNRCPSG